MKTMQKILLVVSLMLYGYLQTHAQKVCTSNNCYLPDAITTITAANESEYGYSWFETRKGFVIFLYLSDKQHIQHFVETRNPKDLTNTIGSGNAFVLNQNEQKYLCTARHCTKAIYLKKIAIGKDAAIIESDKVSGYGYNMAYMENRFDSIWIHGFIVRNDTVKKVSICGIAHQSESKAWAYLQLDNYYDLDGLSGSPVFNNRGEVIGVYRGRLSKTKKHNWRAVISLFQK